MSKKWLSLFLSFVLVMSISITAFASTSTKTEIKVVIDGQAQSFKQPVMVVDGRTLLPYRAISEKIGATVSYYASSKSVTMIKGENSILLKLDSKNATVNGKEVTLDVPARAINGSTYVPVRFLSESVGISVDYNSQTKTVSLQTNSASEPAKPENYTIDIKDFAFSPETLTIPVNSTVTFTNLDSVMHTATAKDGTFDTGLLGEGKSKTITFAEVGEYHLFCGPHPSMTAKIIVKEVKPLEPVTNTPPSDLTLWMNYQMYDKGAKVVYKGEIYEARWWNHNFAPDTPVENSWDSPWSLKIDEVMPNVKIEAAAWATNKGYDTGVRVSHKGLIYEAKWYTLGFAPDKPVENSWDTPWKVVWFE